MKNKKIFISTLMLMLVLFATTAFGAEQDAAKANAIKFGLWTLLPPLISIILAFITKNVVLSLFLGVFSGTFLLALNNYGVGGAVFHG